MKKFKFTISGNEYEVEIRQFEQNLAQVEVNGMLYEVELHRDVPVSKTPILVRSAVPPPTRGETKIRKNIGKSLSVASPLPGSIMHVYVKNGDQVKKGDVLLMYEAMKMENKLMAEREGTVVNLKVKPGDSILQGEVLMEIE
jgi:biotin carboxyl carrier protein